MTKKILAVALATAVTFSISAPVHAADPETRILKIPAGLCPAFKDALVEWASTTTGHAAYSVPRAPRGVSFDCDDPAAAVPTAYSFGYDRQPPANARANEECEVTRPDGYRSCVVVGKAFPISNR